LTGSGDGLYFLTIFSKGFASSILGLAFIAGGEVKSITFGGGGGLAIPEIMSA